MNKTFTIATLLAVLAVSGGFGAFAAFSSVTGPKVQADNHVEGHHVDRKGCNYLPNHYELTTAVREVVNAGGNGGLGNEMWATIVNRDGKVCNVARTGDRRGDQWPGSRVISAQKANTANAFSRPAGVIGFAGPLSTAQLWSAVQPGGSLFGLQFSNPVDTRVAYRGRAINYGKKQDPMVGGIIGGVNVFGGGLALYKGNDNKLSHDDNKLVGAIGLSGDTSCTDHIIAWKTRDALGLDFVPAGVSPSGDDNIIINPGNDFETAFAHPTCSPVGAAPDTIAQELPDCYPIGATVGPVPGGVSGNATTC